MLPQDNCNSQNSSFETSASAPEDQETEDQLLLQLHGFLLQKQKMSEQSTKGEENTTDEPDSYTEESDMELEGGQPKMMDISMVITMFNDLKTKVENLQASNESITQTVALSVGNHLQQQVSMINEEQQKKIDRLETELAKCKHQNKSLVSVVQQYEMEFKDLEQRVENLEVSSAKKCVTLNNYPIGKKKWEQRRDLYRLLEETLNVNVVIDDFYTMGNEQTPTVVITFQSIYDKRVVMKNKYRLKDLKLERKCYINDYTPTGVAEKKCRLLEIQQINEEKKDTEAYLNMETVKGKLVIQNEVYKKRVAPPTIREMIDLDPDRLSCIMKSEIQQGTRLSKKGSCFLGYTAAVWEHKAIRDFYIKLKLTHPSARHIACAYWIPGEDTHYSQDYHDNGDHGAGRALLEVLKQNDLRCRVLFVVRFCAEEKLGPDRVQMYQKAASSAVNVSGMNEILDARQHVKVDGKHNPILQPSKWPRFRPQKDKDEKEIDDQTAAYEPSTHRKEASKNEKSKATPPPMLPQTMEQLQKIQFNFAPPKSSTSNQ